MTLLDGKTLKEKILQRIAKEVQVFKKKHSLVPGLALIRVGDDLPSKIYVNNKIKACQQLNFHSLLKEFPAEITKEDLKQEIEKINSQKNIHALLVQLPLPSSFNTKELFSWIDPKKDVDALTIENQGLLWSGSPRIVPCTPQGIIALLKHYKIPIQGKRAVVVGRSQIVGLPLAQQFLSHQATVTIGHSQTQNLSEICRTGDIVAVCAGKKSLLGKEDFKKGAVVVDVGIHREKNKLFGDVRREGLEGQVSALTPVPGGVGPMTIAMLMENCLKLAKLSVSHQ